MTLMLVEPGDDARAAERVVALIAKYAVRFDPVDRITFYSGILRGLAPIRADLAAQLRRRPPKGLTFPLCVSCVIMLKVFVMNSIGGRRYSLFIRLILGAWARTILNNPDAAGWKDLLLLRALP
jgi:hypothetical protein